MNLDDRLRDLLNDTGEDLALRPAGSSAVAATARRRSARNRMVAGTAAVMAVGGLAITGTLIGGRGEREPDVALAPKDETTRIEAAEEPAESVVGGAAEDSGAPSAPFATLTRVAASSSGSQLAAIGDLTGEGVNGLWVSADGLTWNLAPAPVPEDGSFLTTVAVYNGSIIAGGNDVNGAPLVASTVDGGTTWQRSELPVAEGSVTTVVAGPAGVVVALSANESSTLWSADGITFAADGLVPQTNPDLFTVASAEGFVRVDVGNVVSFSTDGLTWNPATIDVAGGFVGGLAASGNTVMAVGSGADGTGAAAWRSTDGGATWVSAPELVNAVSATEDGSSPPTPTLGFVAGADSGFAVVSTTYDAAGVGTSLLATSRDGVSWTATPVGDLYEPLGTNVAYVTGLAIADDLVVIAAGETSPEGSGIITWVVNTLPS